MNKSSVGLGHFGGSHSMSKGTEPGKCLACGESVPEIEDILEE